MTGPDGRSLPTNTNHMSESIQGRGFALLKCWRCSANSDGASLHPAGLNMSARGGRVDAHVDNIDPRVGIGIRVILAGLDRYFSSLNVK